MSIPLSPAGPAGSPCAHGLPHPAARFRALIAALLLLLCRGGAAAATRTLQDVEHVVIFMQENRSFDHYLGTLRGIRGFSDPAAVQLTNGNSVLFQPNGRTFLLPTRSTNQCIDDLDHSWSGGHDAWHNGRWDRWIPAKTGTTMAYYTRAELPFHYALADAFTVCDAYHCSVLGPSNPNRLYLWTGMIDPRGTGGGPIIDNSEPSAGFGWKTYPERLEAAGVSWKVYQEADNFDDNALAWFTTFINAKPGSALYDKGMARTASFVSAFRKDVTNNTLPKVSWLIAPTDMSEHPVASPASGAAITKRLLDVLQENPAVYASTVFILNFDENDGFYDHVPPPTPPAGVADEFVGGAPIGLGVRVPMILISPWSRGGYVCSELFDHTSVLKFLEKVTGVAEPNISAWRRQICGDLTSAFDFAHPDFSFPSLPAVTPVACFSGSSPRIPAPQVLPVQEPGTRPARDLGYRPEAAFAADCGTNRFSIVMTNAGTLATHFSIYANTNRADGPWQYDIAPGGSLSASFLPSTNGIPQGYDFTCYGPDGFLRRFAGDRASDCPAVEVDTTADPALGGMVLVFRNRDAAARMFTVKAGTYLPGGPWSYEVPAGGSLSKWFPVSLADQGRYDFTVTVKDLPTFIRRAAGRVQSARPPLAAGWADGRLRLTYPASAIGVYVLETAPRPDGPEWTAVSATPAAEDRLAVIDLGAPSEPAFFRLRRHSP